VSLKYAHEASKLRTADKVDIAIIIEQVTATYLMELPDLCD